MAANALCGCLVAKGAIEERPLEYGPDRKRVRCGRAHCTSPRFVQRIDPEELEADVGHTTSDACIARDVAYKNSSAAKKAKGRYRESATARSSTRRAPAKVRSAANDAELHAHEQQEAAEYRANNALRSMAESNAEYTRRAPNTRGQDG